MTAIDELGRLIVEHGHVVRDERSHLLTYGWVDYDADNHARKCRVLPLGSPWAEWWSEFEGTFVENSNHEGVEVKVMCECKRLNGRVIRWEAKLRDVMRSTMPDDVREMRGRY
jgi:hypothetical protein